MFSFFVNNIQGVDREVAVDVAGSLVIADREVDRVLFQEIDATETEIEMRPRRTATRGIHRKIMDKLRTIERGRLEDALDQGLDHVLDNKEYLFSLFLK